MNELTWTHATTEIPEKGLPVERAATPEELEKIRTALDILACDSLATRYRLRAIPGNGFRLEGSFAARVTQACVVSLEPVQSHVDGQLLVEFRPESVAARTPSDDDTIDPFDAVETEPIVNGVLDAGRVIFEELASQLDPYPRAAGINFDWKDPLDSPDGTSNASGPFASLASLKPKTP